jgi:HD-GYP domain-containing protein (c-di-GMP phosphodiesterase class II)
MTSVRVYRDALPLAEAVVEIRRFAGTQFCPQLVEALCVLIEAGLVDELKKVKATISFNSLHANWSRGHVLS